jgi:putative flippase GtrA
MMRRSAPDLRSLVGTPAGRKIFRYSLASVVNVIVGEAILALAFGVLGWSASAAAVLAAVIAAGPAYWLARRWVWGRSGRSHLMKEIVPFWAMALVGLALTTWAAQAAERFGRHAGATRLGQTAIVMGAVLAASGLFWVARFLVLNRFLFGEGPQR